MTAEDRASELSGGDSIPLPWWNVHRPGTLHLYIGLCWAFTPLAFVHLGDLIGQSKSVGLLGIGLVWVIGHGVLTYYMLSLRLIQRIGSKLLFVAALVTASVSAAGTAVLIIVPEAVSVSDFKLITTARPLLTGALALLALSARRSGPR